MQTAKPGKQSHQRSLKYLTSNHFNITAFPQNCPVDITNDANNNDHSKNKMLTKISKFQLANFAD